MSARFHWSSGWFITAEPLRPSPGEPQCEATATRMFNGRKQKVTIEGGRGKAKDALDDTMRELLPVLDAADVPTPATRRERRIA